MEGQYKKSGKAALFERLKEFLTADREKVSYAETAGDLDLSEGAVKVAVHRLRRRYRELLRPEVAQTVASPDELEEELRLLFLALG